MTDTKNPSDPATGCAPLGRPMAETVDLEAVWTAAFVSVVMTMELPLYKHETDHAVGVADQVVAALLVAHPRGGR